MPSNIVVDGQNIGVKTKMLNFFNKHFVTSGFLFQSQNCQPRSLLIRKNNAEVFNFRPFTTIGVKGALKQL